MATPKREQIEITERLQMKLLERFEKLLDKGELLPTDAATLARLLRENGWTLDPDSLPAGLKSVLTKEVNLEDFEDPDNFPTGGAH